MLGRTPRSLCETVSQSSTLGPAAVASKVPRGLKRISRGVPRVGVRLVRNVLDSRSQSWIVPPAAVAIMLFAPRARLSICSAWVSIVSRSLPLAAEKRETTALGSR